MVEQNRTSAPTNKLSAVSLKKLPPGMHGLSKTCRTNLL
jgi:hypothetical protein